MRGSGASRWHHGFVAGPTEHRPSLERRGPSPLDEVPRELRIRTFHGRHGRVTDRMRRVLEQHGPHHHVDARSDHDRPLVLEVGAGHGEAALAYATHRPGHDVLAVDVHTPGVVALLCAAHDGDAGNVFAMRADALDLLADRFTTSSLAALHLFFPDPWPKMRHHKRRFVRPDVLDLVADRLAPGAVFRMATDVDDYAGSAQDCLDGHPRFTGGVVDRPAWRPTTRYEAAARAAGRLVVDLEYHRR